MRYQTDLYWERQCGNHNDLRWSKSCDSSSPHAIAEVVSQTQILTGSDQSDEILINPPPVLCYSVLLPFEFQTSEKKKAIARGSNNTSRNLDSCTRWYSASSE